MKEEGNYNLISSIEVSFLIRTKNEERYIGQLLERIFEQTYSNFEVLIIDSGSTDRTLEIAQKYDVTIYKIRADEFTFGYSLNYGFMRATGKYVVCLSAHALPLSINWLKTVIDNFQDETVAAVMTRTMPWPDCNPFDRRGLIRKYNKAKMDIARGPLFFFSNANSVIKRDVWEKVPFDETLTGSEDNDWQMKAGRLGYKIIYEPQAKVYHSHNESLRQIYKRYYRESYALKVVNLWTYTFINILFDAVAGSIYDMFYVIFKMDNIKWFFFAPMRRFTMNYARFKASRKKKK